MFISFFEFALKQGADNMLWFAVQTVLERNPQSNISIHWGRHAIIQRFQATLNYYEESAVKKVLNDWLDGRNFGDFIQSFEAVYDLISRFKNNIFKAGDFIYADVYHLDTQKTLRHYAHVESSDRCTIVARELDSGDIFKISPFTGFRPVPKTLGYWYKIAIPSHFQPQRDEFLSNLIERLQIA